MNSHTHARSITSFSLLFATLTSHCFTHPLERTKIDRIFMADIMEIRLDSRVCVSGLGLGKMAFWGL